MTWGIQPHFWLTPPELENCGHVGKYANLTVFGCLAVLSVGFWELPTINCMANAPPKSYNTNGHCQKWRWISPKPHPSLTFCSRLSSNSKTLTHHPHLYSVFPSPPLASTPTSTPLLLPSAVHPYSLHIISSSSTTSSCIPYLRTPLPFPAFALIFNNLD